MYRGIVKQFLAFRENQSEIYSYTVFIEQEIRNSSGWWKFGIKVEKEK